MAWLQVGNMVWSVPREKVAKVRKVPGAAKLYGTLIYYKICDEWFRVPKDGVVAFTAEHLETNEGILDTLAQIEKL